MNWLLRQKCKNYWMPLPWTTNSQYFWPLCERHFRIKLSEQLLQMVKDQGRVQRTFFPFVDFYRKIFACKIWIRENFVERSPIQVSRTWCHMRQVAIVTSYCCFELIVMKISCWDCNKNTSHTWHDFSFLTSCILG